MYRKLLTLILFTAAGRVVAMDSILGIYKHSRTGKTYELIAVARSSENPQAEFAVYKQLYDSKLEPQGTPLPAGTVWVRPKEMFFESVELPDGTKAPRFKKIG